MLINIALVFVCAIRCAHVCVWMHVYMCVQVHIWQGVFLEEAQKTTPTLDISPHILPCLKQDPCVCFLPHTLASSPMNFPAFFRLPLPSQPGNVGITDSFYPALNGLWGFEFRSSWLCDKPSSPSHLPCLLTLFVLCVRICLGHHVQLASCSWQLGA